VNRIDRALELHRDELKQCRRCGHSHEVQPIVSLARSPRIVLVGQAPGKTEAAGGRPFAGRAGRTLFGWFARIGIDEATARARIYIAAVTRCFPGPSASGRGDRVPAPAERRNCSEWLERELQIIRPSLIIPVGRLAIEHFLGAQPLEDVVGREHVATQARDTQRGVARPVIVPLPHPSGASSWIHTGNHPRLLETALQIIGRHWVRIHPSRRVA
jgi:uracil-DNA glycosylase